MKFRCRWDIFDVILVRFLGELGATIGRHPSHFITIPILLSLFFGTGLQHLYYTSDPEYLFVPLESPGRNDRLVIEKYFPPTYNSVSRGLETRYFAEAHLIVQASDGGSLLRSDIWKEIRMLDEGVVNRLRVFNSISSFNFTFESVCAKFKTLCLRNDFLNMEFLLGPIVEKKINLTYPVFRNPYTYVEYRLPAHFGGLTLSHNNSVIEDVKAFRLSYLLDASNSSQKMNSRLWETAFLDFISNTRSSLLKLYKLTSKATEIELSRNVDSGIEKLPWSIGLVLAYTIWNSIHSDDSVLSKPYVALIGVLNIVMATLSAWGLLMYIGVQWQSINLAVMFIMLGVGLDDIFVLLAAWKQSPSYHSLPDRMKTCYQEAAVSITITSMTNITSFLVGSLLPGFPSVYIFCLYSGVGIIFIYVWTLTFFGGVLALGGQFEAANKSGLTCRPLKAFPSSSSSSISNCFSVKKKSPLSIDDKVKSESSPEILVIFFRDYWSPFLSNKLTKLFILLVFICYFALSIFYIPTIQEGLERSKLVLTNSYLASYFEKEDELFRKNPYRLQIVITEPLDYSKNKTREDIRSFISKLKESTFVSSNNDYLEYWLDAFDVYVNRKNSLIEGGNVSSHSGFMSELSKALLLEPSPLSLIQGNLHLNENHTQVLASRFLLQTSEVRDANDEKAMVQQLRKIVSCAPFSVLVFHPLFVFFDQFIEVVPTTISCVLLSTCLVMLCTVILIPNVICAFWVTFTIVSIQVGLLGAMAALHIHLDVISMMCLIMSIGFSVDFSAHVSYHFVTSESTTSLDRMKGSLSLYGLPIVQGALSTILAVFPLYFHQSYILSTFAKLLSAVIVLGVLHSLILLPVLLSLTNNCHPCRKKYRESSLQKQYTDGVFKSVEDNDEDDVIGELKDHDDDDDDERDDERKEEEEEENERTSTPVQIFKRSGTSRSSIVTPLSAPLTFSSYPTNESLIYTSTTTTTSKWTKTSEKVNSYSDDGNEIFI